LIRGFVAPELPEEARDLALAVQRLEDFFDAIENKSSTLPIRLVLLALYGYVRARYRCAPEAMSDAQIASFVRELCEPEVGPLGRALERVRKHAPVPLPGMRALTRGVRQLVTTAFYSAPETDHITGYTPVWKRAELLAVAPELAPPPARPPVVELLARQRAGRDVASSELFANDGRPRVAVIGSGAGGAVVAAQLSKTCDVAVFESGPGFAPEQYPLDTLSGMALLFRDGLMTSTQGHGVQMLLARLVGGGTVLTSGMSIRTRKATLEAWDRSGIRIDSMGRALDAVERRLRLAPLHEDLLSDLGHIWRGEKGENRDLIFEVPLSNTVTHASQHRADDAYVQAHKRGERCLACGLCNYGCRFGHKLSVEMTFLPDARAQGARVHPNLGVHRLVSERDPGTGEVRVTGLVLERDKKGAPVPVDYVVMAAGAVGTPILMQRSIKHDQALSRLPCAPQVGRYLGFNYGTSVVADFGRVPRKSGEQGIQIHYVASKPGDERYVLENAYLPPALMAAAIPGIGPGHRAWMRKYKQLSMIATTVGSPQRGYVLPSGQVRYDFGASELEVIHESLAVSIRSYLRAGAVRVSLAGVRSYDDNDALFVPGDEGSHEKVLERLQRVVPNPEHLMLMSAHPQGGMRLGKAPEDSVVSPRYNVHGTSNLMVADASLFPSTIVVNPQWTVMALAMVAAEQIAQRIHGREPQHTHELRQTSASAAP
jgi:choline dehydrogenase-like flavoprotein